MRARTALLVAWLGAATARSTAAQQLPNAGPGPTPAVSARAITLSIPRRPGAPVFTEILPAPSLESTVVTDFRQNQPGDGLPVSLPTSAQVSYDDRNLYVLFNCQDDPSNIRAHLARREDIDSDDRVMVYLDTFMDHRRAYVFEVNPLGVQRDGILTEGQGTDYSYDTVWRSDGRLTTNGFVVLITIPFKSLRFSNDERQTWGIALGRHIPRDSEEAYWPAITARLQGFVNQMGIGEGLSNIGAERNATIVPYAAATGSRYLDTKAPAFASGNEGRGGVDAKFVTTTGVTADVTVNPDFSQVESDNPQVTVNRRYEVFFPEKRPFFIENAGHFVTPEAFVFSRRIVDPQFGARLTGKTGGWAFGALIADDRAEGAAVPRDSAFAGNRAGNAIVRIQREVGNESTVGVLATDREFGSSFSRLFAVDTRLKLHPNWIVTGQAARSQGETLDGGSQHGSAIKATIARSGRDFTYSSSFRELSPEFDAALGFIQRVDVRETAHDFGYLRHLDHGPVTSFGPSVTALMDWNYAGERQDWSLQPAFNVYFRRQAGISVYHSQAWELFDSIGFREYSNIVSAYSSQSKLVSLTGSFTSGVGPNYSPADGLPPSLGDIRAASIGLTLRPSQRVKIDESYYFSGFRTRPDAATGQGAIDVYTNHISRTRAGLQFTKELSVRVIVDYNTLVSDASLIDQGTSKRLTADVLATYLVNPFTAIYVGYTEGRMNVDIDPTDRQTLRVLSSPSTPVLRQVFVKVSYRLGL